jgi:chromatin remodeling complex protein RSC6
MTENIEPDVIVASEEEVVAQDSGNASDIINNLIIKMETIFKEGRSFVLELKNIRKEVSKLEKKKVRKTRDPNRPKKSATGFALPVTISKELSVFLEIPEGGLISRTEVLRKIDGYVKKHDLQLPTDRRKINLELNGGAELRKLLGVPSDQPLSYFNLQTYLKPHFMKAETTDTESKTTSETKRTKPAPAKTVAPPETNVKAKIQEAITEISEGGEAAVKKRTIVRRKIVTKSTEEVAA